MNETILGNQLRKVPSIAVGCMRLSEKSKEEMNHFIHSALEQGAYFFDHADIYGGGMSETVFGDAFSHDPSLKREDVFLQSKCGIRQGCYDLSKEYILEAVDGILKRLRTNYLDLLLLHRPDALVEPEEVAAAFDVLFDSGKVRHFGVSNHKPMQIALLQKYVRQPLKKKTPHGDRDLIFEPDPVWEPLLRGAWLPHRRRTAGGRLRNRSRERGDEDRI